MLDELFPIEDSMLMMQHGSVKEARFFEGVKHMGEPFAMPVALEWVESVFKGIQSESDSWEVSGFAVSLMYKESIALKHLSFWIWLVQFQGKGNTLVSLN